MAEYIDIDKTIVVTDTKGRKRETTVRNVLDFNNGAYETADVAPVRHGRWLRITEYEGEGKKRKEAFHYCICSVCKETATAGGCFWDNETPYCPWCGAKMDGGEGNG